MVILKGRAAIGRDDATASGDERAGPSGPGAVATGGVIERSAEGGAGNRSQQPLSPGVEDGENQVRGQHGRGEQSDNDEDEESDD